MGDFDPSEFVAVHQIGKTVRSCFLMGFDERSGKNFDHRKRWIEEELKLLAANFEIDLLAFACLANHFHLLLRSRPDVLRQMSDEQARKSKADWAAWRMTADTKSLLNHVVVFGDP